MMFLFSVVAVLMTWTYAVWLLRLFEVRIGRELSRPDLDDDRLVRHR